MMAMIDRYSILSSGLIVRDMVEDMRRGDVAAGKLSGRKSLMIRLVSSSWYMYIFNKSSDLLMVIPI